MNKNVMLIEFDILFFHMMEYNIVPHKLVKIVCYLIRKESEGEYNEFDKSRHVVFLICL